MKRGGRGRGLSSPCSWTCLENVNGQPISVCHTRQLDYVPLSCASRQTTVPHQGLLRCQSGIQGSNGTTSPQRECPSTSVHVGHGMRNLLDLTSSLELQLPVEEQILIVAELTRSSCNQHTRTDHQTVSDVSSLHQSRLPVWEQH